jgi:hypothetical protein
VVPCNANPARLCFRQARQASGLVAEGGRATLKIEFVDDKATENEEVVVDEEVDEAQYFSEHETDLAEVGVRGFTVRRC